MNIQNGGKMGFFNSIINRIHAILIKQTEQTWILPCQTICILGKKMQSKSMLILLRYLKKFHIFATGFGKRLYQGTSSQHLGLVIMSDNCSGHVYTWLYQI